MLRCVCEGIFLHHLDNESVHNVQITRLGQIARIALLILAACSLVLFICHVMSHLPRAMGYSAGFATVGFSFAFIVSYAKFVPRIFQRSSDRHVLQEFGEDILSEPETSELPSEMRIKILSYLTPVEVIKMCLVNHAWREAASDDTIWAQHCGRRLIPLSDTPGGCKKKFIDIYKLVRSVSSRKFKQKVFHFKDMQTFLVAEDRIFVGLPNAVQVWDRHFKKLIHTFEITLPQPERLKLVGDTLFCVGYRFADEKRLWPAVVRCHLDSNTVIDKKEIYFGLKDWRKLEAKILEFSENDLAFLNHMDGSIRIWNIEPDFTQFDDGTERIWPKEFSYEYYSDNYETDNYTKCLERVEIYKPLLSSEKYEEEKNNFGNLLKIQTQKLSERRILSGHTGSITQILCLGNYLFSGAKDGTIKKWDLNADQCVLTIDTELPEGAEVFSIHQKYIFGFRNIDRNTTTCKLWDLDSGSCVHSFDIDRPVKNYSIEGPFLFFSHNSTIYIFDLCTGEKVTSLKSRFEFDYSGVDEINVQVFNSQIFLNYQDEIRVISPD